MMLSAGCRQLQAGSLRSPDIRIKNLEEEVREDETSALPGKQSPFWLLALEASLELGCWNLELPQRSCGPT